MSHFTVEPATAHLDYLLENNKLLQIPQMIKKPNPDLLHALVERAVESKCIATLDGIFSNYNDSQLAFLKNEKELNRKIRIILNTDSEFPDEKKLPIIQRIENYNIVPVKWYHAFFPNESVLITALRTALNNHKLEDFISHNKLGFLFKIENRYLLKQVVVEMQETIQVNHISDINNIKLKLHNQSLKAKYQGTTAEQAALTQNASNMINSIVIKPRAPHL